MALGTIEHRTQWLVNRMIARGGMGTVYEARQLGSAGFEKRVAVKLLNESVSADPEHCRKLVDEAKLCANLVHENIVQIYQLVFHDTRYVVVMELCQGVSLLEFIERHHSKGLEVDVDLAAFIASRVCRALHYAHTLASQDGKPLGIVHRDVCPNNILVTLGGVVKLCDFGIAKARVLPDREGEIVQGKARYMAPEQASFQPTDARSDLFSLGVVLYEALAGRPLFKGSSTSETFKNVLEKAIPPIQAYRPNVPEQLSAILDCALQRDPDKRFQDARTMSYQLEYYLYHDGYGPTNERLQEYLQDLFPERFVDSNGVDPGAPVLGVDVLDKTAPTSRDVVEKTAALRRDAVEKTAPFKVAAPRPVPPRV